MEYVPCKIFSAKRIVYSWFHPETRNPKIDPVNPVFFLFKIRIHSINFFIENLYIDK